MDAPGSDGKSSMPKQFKRPNPWRKMMMMTYSDNKEEFNIQFAICSEYFNNAAFTCGVVCC